MRFLAFLVVLCLPFAALAEKRAAFVVGNSDYENAPALLNPTRDARLIADTRATGTLRLQTSTTSPLSTALM